MTWKRLKSSSYKNGNVKLIAMREELGMSQAEISHAIGISPAAYNAHECNRRGGFAEDGAPRETALAIANFHCVELTDIWAKTPAAERLEAVALLDERMRLEAAVPFETALTFKRWIDRMPAALYGCDTRQRKALQLCFWLDWSYEDIGLAFNVSRERARQILYAGMRNVAPKISASAHHRWQRAQLDWQTHPAHPTMRGSPEDFVGRADETREVKRAEKPSNVESIVPTGERLRREIEAIREREREWQINVDRYGYVRSPKRRRRLKSAKAEQWYAPLRLGPKVFQFHKAEGGYWVAPDSWLTGEDYDRWREAELARQREAKRPAWSRRRERVANPADPYNYRPPGQMSQADVDRWLLENWSRD